tara:strand:- start:3758 stop:6481 length:2724 start_codon:yes stop_codon:yes gene_type:complete
MAFEDEAGAVLNPIVGRQNVNIAYYNNKQQRIQDSVDQYRKAAADDYKYVTNTNAVRKRIFDALKERNPDLSGNELALQVEQFLRHPDLKKIESGATQGNTQYITTDPDTALDLFNKNQTFYYGPTPKESNMEIFTDKATTYGKDPVGPRPSFGKFLGEYFNPFSEGPDYEAGAIRNIATKYEKSKVLDFKGNVMDRADVHRLMYASKGDIYEYGSNIGDFYASQGIQLDVNDKGIAELRLPNIVKIYGYTTPTQYRNEWAKSFANTASYVAPNAGKALDRIGQLGEFDINFENEAWNQVKSKPFVQEAYRFPLQQMSLYYATQKQISPVWLAEVDASYSNMFRKAKDIEDFSRLINISGGPSSLENLLSRQAEGADLNTTVNPVENSVMDNIVNAFEKFGLAEDGTYKIANVKIPVYVKNSEGRVIGYKSTQPFLNLNTPESLRNANRKDLVALAKFAALNSNGISMNDIQLESGEVQASLGEGLIRNAVAERPRIAIENVDFSNVEIPEEEIAESAKKAQELDDEIRKEYFGEEEYDPDVPRGTSEETSDEELRELEQYIVGENIPNIADILGIETSQAIEFDKEELFGPTVEQVANDASNGVVVDNNKKLIDLNQDIIPQLIEVAGSSINLARRKKQIIDEFKKLSPRYMTPGSLNAQELENRIRRMGTMAKSYEWLIDEAFPSAYSKNAFFDYLNKNNLQTLYAEGEKKEQELAEAVQEEKDGGIAIPRFDTGGIMRSPPKGFEGSDTTTVTGKRETGPSIDVGMSLMSQIGRGIDTSHPESPDGTFDPDLYESAMMEDDEGYDEAYNYSQMAKEEFKKDLPKSIEAATLTPLKDQGITGSNWTYKLTNTLLKFGGDEQIIDNPLTRAIFGKDATTSAFDNYKQAMGGADYTFGDPAGLGLEE